MVKRWSFTAMLLLLTGTGCDAAPPDTYSLTVVNDLPFAVSLERCAGAMSSLCATTADAESILVRKSLTITAEYPDAGPWVVRESNGVQRCLRVMVNKYPTRNVSIFVSVVPRLQSTNAACNDNSPPVRIE